MICKYCGGIACFPPKTKWGGWCCQPTFYQCPGYKNKIVRFNNVPWNKGLTAKTDSRIFEKTEKAKEKYAARVFKHTAETKIRISESMRGNNNAKHRGDRQSFYKGIRMDSSWEVKVAHYLDSKNINWVYGEKVFPLTQKTSYRPDFVLSCGKIIEVKGYWREENKEKFNLWRRLYPEVKYEIWDKRVLKEFKIL